jgi:asparagine synthase (glutamine-hydrolysing)
MCGLTGFLETRSARSRDDSLGLVERMTDSLTHRGPDDQGLWLDESGTVAFGHRRLAILDTSPEGRQPMTSRCGRFVIVFNGEVYNHQDLRSELRARGHEFRGHSDTETLVAGIAEWGIEETARRSIGMFALAVWDQSDQSLTLVRDRLGIKPLYFGMPGGTFLFGSELKALRSHPAFDTTIDRGALARFTQHCYVPGPLSIYSSIRKLQPGSLLTLRRNSAGNWPSELPQPQVWWSARDVASQQLDVGYGGTQSEAADRLLELLRDAVRLRMISDVPLGAFLSGGIDSSLVVALMQQQSSRPVKTFTIGFEEDGYNEATFAKSVAEHLKTDHTEYYVTAQEARDVIPKLSTMYDEPFADSSQIPTFLVSQLARQDVTVALSGDGGDELFGGYHRYFHIRDRWRMLDRTPARRVLGWLLKGVGPFAPGSWRDRFESRGRLLGMRDAGSLYQRANLHWQSDSGIVFGADEAVTDYWNHDAWLTTGDPIADWMFLDAVTYLPDDILTKVDRASMAVGLEVRVPIIDHRVFEFAWSLPQDWKVGESDGKLPLRELLGRFVPSDLFERPKMGFGVPIDSWLRGPLRDWAESLLDEHRLRDEGFFDPAAVRRKWDDHLAGRVDWHYHIWDVLMFQSWRDG